MAFKSLSAVINTNIVKAQAAQSAHYKLSSSTAQHLGYVRTIGDLRDEDQDVLTWGSSTWGVQKVTAFYKPKS
jgi:hypothetical protein